MTREDQIKKAAEIIEYGCSDELKAALIKDFPELAEDEDERIRKELLEEIEFIIPHDDETDSEGLILPSYHERIDRYKSYLERQKEQQPSIKEPKYESFEDDNATGWRIKKQPAEWSEEDKLHLNNAILAAEKEWGVDSCTVKWLKSLRPQPHWKPSEEQMDALKNCAYGTYQNGDGPALRELYDALQKLL